MSIPSFLLDSLNQSQQEAVCFKDGPLLVLAGPGSGKTRVVTHRIAALLHQGVGPSQIAALTFTNKAAQEMAHRLNTLAPNKQVWIGTFHRFCALLLRRHGELVGIQSNFTIYDSDESLALIKGIVASQRLPAGITPQKIASSISWAKNLMIRPKAYQPHPGSLLGEVVKDVYPIYHDELQRAHAVDFDDLLLWICILLQENPEMRKILDNRFRYILVDEYQDTNTVQYVIAKALSIDHRNLAVTGDPDQSIYGWRGANIQNILDFEKDFPDAKLIRLENNYRSTPQILAVADCLISNNLYRKQKKLIAENVDGKPVRIVRCFDQKEEADSIAEEIACEIKSGRRKASDFAIFYRMNALSRNLEHALRSKSIPFQLVRGLEFFNRKEIKDILAYLKVVCNPADTIALNRIINEPTRGIGKTSLKKICDKAVELGIPTLDVARMVASDPGSSLGISTKTRKSIGQFVAMIDRVAESASRGLPVESLIEMVLRESGYREQFTCSTSSTRSEKSSAAKSSAAKSSATKSSAVKSSAAKSLHANTANKTDKSPFSDIDPESEADAERLANIDELLAEAHEFDAIPLEDGESGLEKFLEQAALVSDVDALETAEDRVSLMTFHAAKGLEFPVVYIIALEEGILPHERSKDDAMQLEEERRLFFVGITRGREELRISRADRRNFRGSFDLAIFSRFLLELPNDNSVVKYDSPSDFLHQEKYHRDDGITLLIEKNAIIDDDFVDPDNFVGTDADAFVDLFVDTFGKKNDYLQDEIELEYDPDYQTESNIDFDYCCEDDSDPKKQKKGKTKELPKKTFSLTTGIELLKKNCK
ncbi:MAG: ATP-dependent helicase [Thermoguttaceae bacterium]